MGRIILLLCRLAATAAPILLPTTSIAAPVNRAALVSVLSDIDRHFVCPEFRADDAARQQAHADFMQTLSALGPAITTANVDHVWSRMIERHNCDPTFVAVAAPDALPAKTTSSTEPQPVPVDLTLAQPN